MPLLKKDALLLLLVHTCMGDYLVICVSVQTEHFKVEVITRLQGQFKFDDTKDKSIIRELGGRKMAPNHVEHMLSCLTF